jgi:dTMP kinase
MNGVFLSLDGLDGSGKSTQLELLANWLGAEGYTVTRCREPGGTAIGESIRGLLLDPASEMSTTTEMLLYMASRAEIVTAVIRPALERGEVVLCDRFLLATIVYQGHAGGLDPEIIRKVGLIATGGLLPVWTGVLDVDAETAQRRRHGPADRIEARSRDYHEKVRQGYLKEAGRDPDRIRIIDASGDPKVVHQSVITEVRRALDSARRS